MFMVEVMLMVKVDTERSSVQSKYPEPRVSEIVYYGAWGTSGAHLPLRGLCNPREHGGYRQVCQFQYACSGSEVFSCDTLLSTVSSIQAGRVDRVSTSRAQIQMYGEEDTKPGHGTPALSGQMSGHAGILVRGVVVQLSMHRRRCFRRRQYCPSGSITEDFTISCVCL